MEKFNVGDIVYSKFLGTGVIISVPDEWKEDYCLKVDHNGIKVSYTYEGMYLICADDYYDIKKLISDK